MLVMGTLLSLRPEKIRQIGFKQFGAFHILQKKVADMLIVIMLEL